MPSRVCSHCQQSKSIRGVWYLTPSRSGPAAFVCEACYSSAAREVALTGSALS